MTYNSTIYYNNLFFEKTINFCTIFKEKVIFYIANVIFIDILSRNLSRKY